MILLVWKDDKGMCNASATEVEQVGKRKATTSVYVRNAYVSAYVKKRANGYCDLCGEPAPFKDRNG